MSTFICDAQANIGFTWNAEVNSLRDSRYLLKNQLSDSLYHATDRRSVKKKERAIKSKNEAIHNGKLALSEEFGKEDNVNQRIFRAHLINGFWVVKGLLPHSFTGGILVAIIDSENGELIKTLVWK